MEPKDNKHVLYLEEESKKWYTKLHNLGGNVLSRLDLLEEKYLSTIPEILRGMKAIFSEVKAKEVSMSDIIDDLDKRLKVLEEQSEK